MLNTIRHAFDIGRKEWGIYLPDNPAKLVRRPTLPRGRERRLREDEEARLYAARSALRAGRDVSRASLGHLRSQASDPGVLDQ